MFQKDFLYYDNTHVIFYGSQATKKSKEVKRAKNRVEAQAFREASPREARKDGETGSESVKDTVSLASPGAVSEKKQQ